MNLIIAEKKLAAYAYARALSTNFKEYEGYLEGDNQIIYTWAQGHLLQLMEPGEIREEWEVWDWNYLPILPEFIPLKPIKHQEKQLYLIQKLAKRCTLLINGTDAGLAGELIMDEIVRYLKLSHLPCKRLWTASLQVTAIRNAYQQMKDQSEYELLKVAANVRSRLDYLTGINTSRSLSLVGDGQTLAMGRLIGSSLALVHQREQARETFAEEAYYTLKATFQQGERFFDAKYSGPRITDKETLESYLTIIEETEGQLDYVDHVKELLPPILLNHTDVLVIMHQRYGMKPKETNRHLENLYIKGLISYPRTDARYVTVDEITPMRAAFLILREVYPNLAKGSDMDKFHRSNERLVNEVSDHHALIPTPAVPKELKEEEKWVYQLILERFFLQAQQPQKNHVRQLKISYSEQLTFKKTLQITINAGWKGLVLDFAHEESPSDEPDEIETEVVETFPEYHKDVPVRMLEANSKAQTTKPPGQYTEGTLIKQMENISNVIENDKYKKALKGCGIGTSATRAETVQKLQDIGYITVEKKKLVLTALGESVLALLNFEQAKQILSPEMTALWELNLTEIKEGKPPAEFEQAIIHFIQAFVAQMKLMAKKQVSVTASAHKCPECHSAIKATQKTFRCSACDFFIWKSQFFKTITPKMLDDLLKKGETTTLTFTSKDKKSKYKAKLAMPVEKGKLKLQFLS